MQKAGLAFVAVILIVIVAGISQCGHSKKKYTIGIAQWVQSNEYSRNVSGFKDEMAARGYKEFDNVKYIIQISNADKLRQETVIKQFKDQKVDLIYSLTTPGTLVAKKIVTKIPIVFSIVTYPVETGVIASISNSGCNCVGTRNYVPPSRQFYAFERIYPNVKSIAFVHRKGEPNSAIQFEEFKKLLKGRNINIIEIAASDTADLTQQLGKIKNKVDAIYAACDTLIQSGGEEIIIAFCRRNAMPSFSCNKAGVQKGALVGNVADFYSLGKISGEKAAMILSGADPTWLQTESPRDDYIIVNLQTASRLNVPVPDDIIGQAKEIIR